jgi:hypothetical protein
MLRQIFAYQIVACRAPVLFFFTLPIHRRPQKSPTASR